VISRILRAHVLLALGILAGIALAVVPEFARSLDFVTGAVVARAGLTPASDQPIAEPAGVGALGRVDPVSRVRRLAPPATVTMNRVERLFVKQGDNVTAGQVLAEFADAPQKRAAVAQADAQVAEAMTELQRVIAAARPEDIVAQRERIASLHYQVKITQADADRADALVPSGAGARAVAERADAAANRAAAELREAEARLTSLTSARPEDIAVAQAKVRSAEAGSERARADAALCEVLAPISGKILKIYAQPGDLVGPEGLLELADLDRMEVVADVYETDLSRVRIGAQADVSVPGTTLHYSAEVREISRLVKRELQAGTDPTAAVDGRTVEVRLALDPAGSRDLSQRVNSRVQVAIHP
jgi:HlyD family secretion protein